LVSHRLHLHPLSPSFSLHFLLFFLILHPPPIFTLFPYTTLFRSVRAHHPRQRPSRLAHRIRSVRPHTPCTRSGRSDRVARRRLPDRKSTRLNSSHGSISYAVFCLKKKKK